MTRRAPEKALQKAIKDLFGQFGWECVDFSQPRATMQTPGIPDLLVYPKFWSSVMRGGMSEPPSFWFEVKIPDGKQSEAQAAWEARCRRHGEGYLIGGMYEAIQVARHHGYKIEFRPGDTPWRKGAA